MLQKCYNELHQPVISDSFFVFVAFKKRFCSFHRYHSILYINTNTNTYMYTHSSLTSFRNQTTYINAYMHIEKTYLPN